MARIKIKNLPKDMKVSTEEMRKISGGLLRISDTSNIMSRFPARYEGELTYNYIAWAPPQEMAGCACMGMGQNPKTEMLPG